jgi:hypothetical protein
MRRPETRIPRGPTTVPMPIPVRNRAREEGSGVTVSSNAPDSLRAAFGNPVSLTVKLLKVFPGKGAGGQSQNSKRPTRIGWLLFSHRQPCLAQNPK